MIKVENISKKFIKKEKNQNIEFFADKDIAFEANDGEILGILGPNGAGKTTLLRIIAGIMEATKGKVLINSLNYNESELEIKKQIAFLSGNTKLYKDMSCYELLKMCSQYYELDKKTIEDRIGKISNKLELGSFINQRIGTLSTGQMQRVNIARCILHNPKYYIFDEATSGLDIISSEVILNFIKEEKKHNKCIIYSTHYMEEAENICDRVVLMHKGNIIDIDTPKNIVKKTKTTNLRDAFFVLIRGGNNE